MTNVAQGPVRDIFETKTYRYFITVAIFIIY